MKQIFDRYEVRTYKLCDEWRCEIELDKQGEFGAIYNCYLIYDRCGTKMFLFGLPEYQECEDKHYTWEDIEEMVEASAADDINFYLQELVFGGEPEFDLSAAVDALGEYYECERDEETGEYDFNDYDWVAGCGFGNGKWLSLGEVVKVLAKIG